MRSKVMDTSLQPGAGSDLIRRPSKRESIALMVMGAVLLLSAGVHATTAEAVSGYAMSGCGGDSDDPPGNAEPCIARYLSRVWVGMEVGGHTVASTTTNSEGRFSIEGSGEILGGGSCGEQPKGEPRLPASEVILFYPNDGDDSPYGTCPATMDGAPTVESESVSDLSSTSVVLEAKINPQNAQRGADYQFQVVAEPNEYSPTFTCPAEGWPANSSLCLGLPEEMGALPLRETSPGTQCQQVSTNLADLGDWGSGSMALKPETTYHYRVIVAKSVLTVDTIAWEPPIVYGPDQTFTTSPVGVQPVTTTGGSGGGSLELVERLPIVSTAGNSASRSRYHKPRHRPTHRRRRRRCRRRHHHHHHHCAMGRS